MSSVKSIRLNPAVSRKVRQLMFALCAIAMTWIVPLATMASEDEKEPYDARLENYAQSVTLDTGSTALIWILLIILAVLCMGVLFKNANRSHLD